MTVFFLRRFVRSLLLSVALVAIPATGFASGSALISARVLDAGDQPVAGARVVFTGSAGQTFTAYTDRGGRSTITLPLDTYTIVATHAGYASEIVKDIEIAAKTDLSISLTRATPSPAPTHSPSPAPTRTPSPTPTRTPSPTPTRTPSPTPTRTPVAAATRTPVPAPAAAVVQPSPASVPVAVRTAAPLPSTVPTPQAPRPTPQAAPSVTVAVVPATTPPPIFHDALLATYDARHPEHVPGEPYFGRYTYVLLGGNGASDPRNRELLAALVARFGVASSVGNQTVVGNPLGYNIFFLPIKDSTREAPSGSTVDAMLAEYDFKTARYLRDRYCAAAEHAESSICAQPIPQGPFMLTLTRPLQGLRAHDPFPATFGYDFSAVSPDQFLAAVSIIALTATVPEPSKADLELPPAELAKYIGPAFVASGAALRRSVPALRVSVDNGLLG